MEGDWGMAEVCAVAVGELVTMLKMEDGPADGNLIAREGIFLGKGELAVETPVDSMTEMSITGIAHEFGS